MKLTKIVYLIFLLTADSSYADQIELENKTDAEVAVAIYYVNNNKTAIVRQTNPQVIAPLSTVVIERPSFEFGKDRELLFSQNIEDLQENLDKNSFHLLSKQNIGFFKGRKFYITYQNGKYFAYSSFYAPIAKLTELSNDQIRKILSSFSFTPHEESRQALVKRTNQLCQSEEQFINNRKSEIKNNLESFFELKTTQQAVPVIGICLSGGGFRAMIGSLGFLRGLKEEKILDLVTYVSVLSGSSWAVIPWAMTGDAITDIGVRVQKATLGNFYSINSKEFLDIELAFLTKLLYRKPLSIIDLWGALIAHAVLTGLRDPQNIGFSRASPKIQDGNMPLPLATMVTNNLSHESKEYTWFEISPFEFGSAALPAYIPTWASGKSFSNGSSTDNAPELTVAFIMGICGSAFSVGVGDILDRLPVSIDKLGLLIGPLLNSFEKQYEFIRRTRLIPGGYVANPLHNISKTPRPELKYLQMVDGGYAFNLPFAPLLRPERSLDIIIAFDLGGDIIGVPALISAADYARKRGLKFPVIDYKEAEKKHFSIFGNPDNKNELIVIYIPRIANDKLLHPYSEFDPEKASSITGFASTFNFRYTQDNVSLLDGYAHDVVRLYKNEIIDLIKRRIKAKED